MTESAAATEQQTIAPDAGTSLKPMTEAEAVNSLTDLLNDDALTELEQPKPDRKAKEAKEDEPAPEKEDPLGPDDEEEDVEEGEPEVSPDASQDSAGKFVSATSKFKLADGTVISVGDLARNNLYQRDYSQKTEVMAREKDELTKVKTEVDQLSRTLSEERQFLLWFAEKHVPKQPAPPAQSALQDPVGHLQFQEDMRKYQEFVQTWQLVKNGLDEDGKRKGVETTKEQNDHAAKEVGELFVKLKIDPQKSPAKAKAFFEAIATGASEFYGLDETTIANLAKQDHRAMLILRDAIRARQNRKAAPDVQEKLRNVPKIVHKPTARTAPNDRQDQARTATKEKLQRSGSFNDGIAAIEALLQ